MKTRITISSAFTLIPVLFITGCVTAGTERRQDRREDRRERREGRRERWQ